MKMTESSKLNFQAVSIFLIAIGIIMFICQVSNSGSAIEACSFNLSVNSLSIIGAGLIVLAVAFLLILHFRYSEKKM